MIDEPVYPYAKPLREDDEKAVAEVIYNKKGEKGILHMYKSKFDKLLIGNGNWLAIDVEFIKLRYGKDVK